MRKVILRMKEQRKYEVIKKLVEMHQGRVWLESEEGSGTSFYMLFPAERVREK